MYEISKSNFCGFREKNEAEDGAEWAEKTGRMQRNGCFSQVWTEPSSVRVSLCYISTGNFLAQSLREQLTQPTNM